MSKIPTAKEFFFKRYKELGINHADEIDGEDEEIAIEFAQLHVEAALKAAAIKAKINPNYSSKYDDPEDRRHEINKESILSAYPKENIK